MNPLRVSAAAAVAPGAGFDEWIDVRSPSEYTLDRLPGAVNWPVLDDAERQEVGTLYVQVSPLAARKRGAALVARRIAGHIETQLADKPRDWRPLVYCWRGGQRSGALALVLAQIGFRTAQLEGGYKAFRALVRDELESLPARLHYRVLCGRTGSGKTRLLRALAARGAQVLDLEALAAHRGSVLGALPGRPQPSQKAFDTGVWQVLRGFDAALPVFVESESARIGSLRVPPALLQAMHERSECLQVVMDDEARTRLLLAEYHGHTLDPEALCRQLEALTELRGRERVKTWCALARAGRWPELIASLMAEHYDPLYEKSMRRSYPRLDAATRVELNDGGGAALEAAAATLLSPREAAAPLVGA